MGADGTARSADSSRDPVTFTSFPRANSRGKPEGDLRVEKLVQVRSIGALRLLGKVPMQHADKLVRRSLCAEELSASGRLEYLPCVAEAVLYTRAGS